MSNEYFVYLFLSDANILQILTCLCAKVFSKIQSGVVKDRKRWYSIYGSGVLEFITYNGW